MNNDEIIAECLTILRSTLKSYRKHPTWDKLKAMFQQTLLLGIELGKKQVYMSQQSKKEKKQVNTVQLIGRLTKDVELRMTSTGKKCASITLAVNRGKEHVDFIPVVLWERTAENLAKYCSKGSQISIVGSIQTRSFKDKDDKTVYVTEVLARECQFLGTKGNTQERTEEAPVSEFEGDTLELEADDLPF